MENLMKTPQLKSKENISITNFQSNTNLKDSLMCPVCYETYSPGDHDPLVLTCGHNICIRVLDKFYANKMIKCPQCNREHTYYSKKDIPKNFALLNVMEFFKQTSYSRLS